MADQKPDQQRLGRYELVKLLEEGGAGSMYRARDTQSGRGVLLKVLARSVTRASAFERYFRDRWSEQQSLLDHPNLLRALALGTEAGRLYLVVEDARGRRLTDVLGDAPLEPDEALNIVHQIAEGLRAVHRQGVVHGHLKPSDIIVTSDQKGRQLVKVTLFDLGVSADDSIVSLPGELLGTPKYMAPEVIKGQAVSAQADVFALGVIAYELFTGREPFPSDHVVGYLFANCQHRPTPADKVHERVPHEVARVLARMLEKDPARRYGSMQRAIDDLVRCAECMKTGHVDVMPHGTDSAFAREYELPEPRRARAGGPVLAAARVITLTGIIAAVGALGFALGRMPAGRPGAARPVEEAARPLEPKSEPPKEAAPAPAEGIAAPAGRERGADQAFQTAMADWQRLSRRGDYELGEALFSELRQKYAGTGIEARSLEQLARIYTEWARALGEAGDPEGAVDKYKKAIEVAPEGSNFGAVAVRNMPSALVDLAEDLTARGQYVPALEVYGQVASDHPGTKEAALLQQRRPHLLLSQAFVTWKDKRQLDEAIGAMTAIIKQFPGTDEATRAERAMPGLYLDAVREKLDDGRFREAREQLVRLAEAYPGHEVAIKAADLDAETLFLLFAEGHRAGDEGKAGQQYAELLRRYPASQWSVQAVRLRLDLEPSATEVLFDDNTGRRQLEQAKGYYDQFDFTNALGALRGVIRFSRAESPVAAVALEKLPQWTYGSAIYAYGTGAVAECEEVLRELLPQFEGLAWEERARLTLERIKEPPEGMLYVPEGRFRMGSDTAEIISLIRSHGLSALGEDEEEMAVVAEVYGLVNETPKHTAVTKAFFIDKTEVTNAQYKQYVDETGNPPPAHWTKGAYPAGEGDLPVVNVSLAEARAYARWRGARLPTEAEWEKAARGVDGRSFPWGEVFSEDRCQHMRPEGAGPAPVGSYPTWASPYGCLDMIGNVEEWTDTEFAPYPGSQAPEMLGQGSYQVVRGGAWYQQEIVPIPARCASRYPLDPASADAATGFRCVRDVAEPEALASRPAEGQNP